MEYILLIKKKLAGEEARALKVEWQRGATEVVVGMVKEEVEAELGFQAVG